MAAYVLLILMTIVVSINLTNGYGRDCLRYENNPSRKCSKRKAKFCQPDCEYYCNVKKCDRVNKCCVDVDDGNAIDDKTNNERIIFANRGRGDIVLIEEGNELASITIPLTDNSEPMYVRNTRLQKEIWIGDRGTNQIFVYDTIRWKQTTILSACNGIFHQSYNFQNQFWLVCDIDLKILVFNVSTKAIIKTINIDNINGNEFKPHDITSSTPYTFVSLIGTHDDTADIGFIIQYSTETFDELNRIEVGGDPHVYNNAENLYVAAQNANLLYKFKSDSLELIDTIDIFGAHGLFGNNGGEYLWVTDITSPDGKYAIYAIDLKSFTLIDGAPFDAVAKHPHNVRSNDEATKLFITHSSDNSVTAYDLYNGIPINGRIIFKDEGSIPFGLMNAIQGDIN